MQCGWVILLNFENKCGKNPDAVLCDYAICCLRLVLSICTLVNTPRCVLPWLLLWEFALFSCTAPNVCSLMEDFLNYHATNGSVWVTGLLSHRCNFPVISIRQGSMPQCSLISGISLVSYLLERILGLHLHFLCRNMHRENVTLHVHSQCKPWADGKV